MVEWFSLCSVNTVLEKEDFLRDRRLQFASFSAVLAVVVRILLYPYILVLCVLHY